MLKFQRILQRCFVSVLHLGFLTDRGDIDGIISVLGTLWSVVSMATGDPPLGLWQESGSWPQHLEAVGLTKNWNNSFCMFNPQVKGKYTNGNPVML